MKNIKIIFMDVDGTLTDGKIHISENGELFKTFNIKDGMAITLLKKMIRSQWRIYREVLRLGFLRSRSTCSAGR